MASVLNMKPSNPHEQNGREKQKEEGTFPF